MVYFKYTEYKDYTSSNDYFFAFGSSQYNYIRFNNVKTAIFFKTVKFNEKKTIKKKIIKIKKLQFLFLSIIKNI